MKIVFRIGLLFFLVLLPALGNAQWKKGDLYPTEQLDSWHDRYRENIQSNFDNLILGKLTPRERRRCGQVRLHFPLRAKGKLRDHPLQFYASGDTITVPILSVKFFDDITQARAYLWSNGLSLDLVGDYLAMLKYRDPADFPGQRIPPPLESCGIAKDAWKHDPKMNDVSQKALKSAIVWILAHELGHIYYRHPGYGPGMTSQEAQENEIEADRFANMIMRRVGVAPVGMVQFFMALAHLEPGRGDFATERAWKKYLGQESTHPLTAKRLELIAEDLRRAPHEFTAEESNQQAAVSRIRYIADQVTGIGKILKDPDLHRLVVAIGLATDLQSLKKHQRALKPVAPGRLCAQDGNPTSFKGLYSGLFTRYLKNGKREWLSARLQLRRNRNRVQGRFFFGAGEGILQGIVVQGTRLVFDWQWGTATGKGSLGASTAGGLEGLWGYGPDSAGGGTWNLCPEG